jgi:hypothetical protein
MLEVAEVKMPGAFSVMGEARYAQQTIVILGMLQTRREMTRTDILKVMYKDVDAHTLHAIMATLKTMGVVDGAPTSDGKDMVYRYKGD